MNAPSHHERLVSACVLTPLGPMLAVASHAGLTLLEFDDRRALPTERRETERQFGSAIEPGTNEHLERTRSELGEYFAGKRHEFTVPLDLRGTAFQRRVWHLLQSIEFGQTRSYVDLARRLGDENATRAVGGANGKNRVAIIVPCHRVIAADRTLGGYGGGLERKQWLLEHEGAIAPAALLFETGSKRA
ncbi:MAG: methylated-DNA--[protein]-cysteine S-methyltransferase [Phycisphaerae bacterium]|nr:methylated-DNA--[protein]-cysteine S-methyltransferase [Phycisphaerae bacterium]